LEHGPARDLTGRTGSTAFSKVAGAAGRFNSSIDPQLPTSVPESDQLRRHPPGSPPRTTPSFFHRLRVAQTAAMSFVTRRALSTLIPPKVRCCPRPPPAHGHCANPTSQVASPKVRGSIGKAETGCALGRERSSSRELEWRVLGRWKGASKEQQG